MPNVEAQLLETLTALGQMKHARDEPGHMTMKTEVRSELVADGWAAFKAARPIFTCAKCGAPHPGLLVVRAKKADEATIQKLKEAWHKAFEAKAGAAYFAEKQNWSYWAVPDTLISKSGPGRAHQLQCASECIAREKEKVEEVMDNCKRCGKGIDRQFIYEELQRRIGDIPETCKYAAENSVYCGLTCSMEDLATIDQPSKDKVMAMKTTYQKIVLTIYAVLSLPILPLVAVIYLFTKWVAYDQKPENMIWQSFFL